MRLLSLILLSFLPLCPVFGKGIPYISNYSKSDYSAAGRNWSVAADAEGNIYTANNSGLLRFNGAEWTLFPLSGNKIARSVYCDGATVYVGSFEEFGFFTPDGYGGLAYTSLSALAEGFQFHNDEIWGIAMLDGKVYFRSFMAYFTWDGHRIEAFPLPFTVVCMEPVGSEMYLFVLEKGLCRLEDGEVMQIIPQNKFNGSINAILPYGDDRLLLFASSGAIYVADPEGRECAEWRNEASGRLREAIINRAVMTADNNYIVGTISDGIYALDAGGRLLWRVNAATGLANNTVLSLGCDRQNNIWATLDNGIAYIRSNSTLSFLFSYRQQIGYVYSAAMRGESLYLATNQGLFYAPDLNASPERTPLKILDGQSWDLFNADGQIFCGNNEGTFEVSGTAVRLVSGIKGGVCMRKGVIHGREVLVQATYTYLNIYLKNGSGRWTFSHTVEGFMHPVRSLEIDGEGAVWAQHFYKGLYRIRLSDDLRTVDDAAIVEIPADEETGLSPAMQRDGRGVVNLFRIRGRIIFSSGSGFFTYDDITDSIKPFEYLDTELARFRDVRRIVPVNDNLYWLICTGKFVLARFDREGVRITEEIPFSSLYNNLPDNDENILVLPDDRYLFCMSNGVALIDRRKPTYNPEWQRRLHIGRVESSDRDRSDVVLLPVSPPEPPRVRHNFNNLTFHVAFPHYPGENVSYSFRLKGVESSWSVPSPQPRVDYARLGKGQYTLQVKAFDNLGDELGTVNYLFAVLPPFYASNLALAVYLLLMFAALGAAIFYTDRHIVRSKEKVLREQVELRQKESERQEHRIMQLQNRKLEDELAHKSRELASSTMSMIKRNEMLVALKEELTEQKEKLGTQYPNKYYERLVGMIDTNLSSEDDWLVFRENFDRIHEHFFRNLKTTYPSLTPTDLKFCALLRLNLNSKEIADLLNITLKGVEIARYRLRKKLGLESTVNLVEFMIQFK